MPQILIYRRLDIKPFGAICALADLALAAPYGQCVRIGFAYVLIKEPHGISQQFSLAKLS